MLFTLRRNVGTVVLSWFRSSNERDANMGKMKEKREEKKLVTWFMHAVKKKYQPGNHWRSYMVIVFITSILKNLVTMWGECGLFLFVTYASVHSIEYITLAWFSHRNRMRCVVVAFYVAAFFFHSCSHKAMALRRTVVCSSRIFSFISKWNFGNYSWNSIWVFIKECPAS